MGDDQMSDETRAALRRVLFGLHPDVSVDGLTASAAYATQPEHRGAPDWVHGGFLATVLDHVGARLARSIFDSRVATGTLDIRYRQPVLLDGGPYPIEAIAAPPGAQTVKIRAVLYDPAGRPLTEGRGLFVSLGMSPHIIG